MRTGLAAEHGDGLGLRQARQTPRRSHAPPLTAPRESGVAWGVECPQLYHAPWIGALRATVPGRLVWGTTFCWSDLIAYTVGGVARRLASSHPLTHNCIQSGPDKDAIVVMFSK